MKQTRMYVCTLKNLFQQISGYIGVEYRSEDAWKNTGLYTLAIKGMRNVRIALDKGLFNRITIA